MGDLKQTGLGSNSVSKKLLAVQSKLKAPKSQKNTFGKYRYRSCEDILEAVKPLLVAEGLTMTISDEMIALNDRVYVKAYVLLTDGVSNVISSAFAREAESKKGMDTAQITGSASSYARKYALNGLFLIDDTKDDDTRKPSDEVPEVEVTGDIMQDRADEIIRSFELCTELAELKKLGTAFADEIKAFSTHIRDEVRNKYGFFENKLKKGEKK